MAAGYCWNDFLKPPTEGYGYMYLHLTEASKMTGLGPTPTLVGGYVELTNQPSTSPMVRSGQWGFQSNKPQPLGRFYAWNPNLNPAARGYLYIYGVTAEAATDAGNFALVVHSGQTLTSSSHDMSNPHLASPWGDPKKGKPISLTAAVDTNGGPWTTGQLAVE